MATFVLTVVTAALSMMLGLCAWLAHSGRDSWGFAIATLISAALTVWGVRDLLS